MPTTLDNPPDVSPAISPNAGPAGAAPSALAPAPRRHRIRTHYVIDWRTQFKGSLYSAAAVIGLVALVNVMFLYLSRATTAWLVLAAPQLAQDVRESARVHQRFTLAFSVVFLLVFVGLRILETHRTAGAAYNLENKLARLARGEFDFVAKLRQGDDLQNLADGVNKVAAAMKLRSRRRVELYEQMALALDRFGPEGKDLRRRIEMLIEQEKPAAE